MIELLYIAIPIALVVIVAVVSSMREHRPHDVRSSVSTFEHARQALERRTTLDARERPLRERGSRGAPE
ncbi:hypothetical protein Afer_1885 [Acidimicrobium ferrooxidans DSM 10331]|uniref:Uncharacterized protein n=1 Tax=Acidimicrobium ferrooxidans (strain DSM 10331 / JCM 15462 / NBRC 103882 / ICP) TaxID=525909 RepID=C7M1P9_ACIFD|nr:hypothetical protein [Acidimicrobium ferrooxidans]ACU54796.1 hypothetical protein Afer_1885 [Acidimicrobium ferrooxidans DSM 10331]